MHSHAPHTFTYILLLNKEECVCRLKNDMEEGWGMCHPMPPVHISRFHMTRGSTSLDSTFNLCQFTEMFSLLCCGFHLHDLMLVFTCVSTQHEWCEPDHGKNCIQELMHLAMVSLGWCCRCGWQVLYTCAYDRRADLRVILLVIIIMPI